MRLTIHLFREEIVSLDGLIRDKYLHGTNAFHPVEIKQKLPYECLAFLQSKHPQHPKWYDYVSSHFNFAGSEILNKNNSFLMFVKMGKRIFAVSFGYGHAAIDEAKLEPRFGLRVTANSVARNELRIIDSRNFDLVTRQRRTYLSVGSSVDEFGVDLNIDLLQRLAGKSSSDTFARNISGANSLSVDVDCPVQDIGKKCSDALDYFKKEEDNELLEFIDNLNRVKSSDSMVPKLYEEVNSRLYKFNSDRITIGYPEIPPDQITKYRVSYRKQSHEYDDLTISKIFEFMKVVETINNPINLNIEAMDDDDNVVGPVRALKDYLIAEVQYDKELFILNAGHWYRAASSYAEKIQSLVNKVEDITDALSLPFMKSGEHEKDYNIRVADQKNYVLLDRKLIHYERRAKIEVCDLLSEEKHFIAVKYMKDSATLSHLFAQGDVSSELLRGDPKFKKSVQVIYNTKWPKKILADPITFVYALPTRKTGKLADNMFFFSKVNLLNHLRSIRNRGFNVALCKIEIK